MIAIAGFAILRAEAVPTSVLANRCLGQTVNLGPTTPILRIFDEAKAREFYVDYLGFTVDWEHRFEPGLPLHMQVSRDGCVLHLSQHYGDCSPGAAMRVAVDDLDAFHAELASKHYKYARPGIEEMPWEDQRYVRPQSIRQSTHVHGLDRHVARSRKQSSRSDAETDGKL